MRAVLLASLVASILATLPPAALQAQGGKVPKRPNLEEGADTNFAPAYYEFGMRKIERDPQKAADAFYWATRLDPAWAQPVYARRIALLMADPRLLVGYMRGNRRFLESKEARRIDSLELRALTLDPFLNRDLDKQDRKSTRLNSSHQIISYAVFCLKTNKRSTSASSLLAR